MERTIFDAPILRTVFPPLARLILRFRGWAIVGEAPAAPKCVMIAAPHTSNWDFPLTLTFAFAFGVKVCWMGKRSLFRFPFGTVMRWLGGIPIDRSRSNDVVAASIETLRRSERLVLIVPPEGTRSRVRYWKTGFYWIAHGAGVPIALGFLDWGRKAGGIGPLFAPKGDIEADMLEIASFYRGMRGKHPDSSGEAGVPKLPDRKTGTDLFNAAG